MMNIIKKILRCLHPLNRINISFEFYDEGRGHGKISGRAPEVAPSPWTFDVLDDEMRELVAKGKKSDNAQVHVIKLEKLEEHYGNKWEKIVGRVHAGIRMILVKNLTEDDSFAQVKNNAYVVMMSKADPREASNRIRKLTDEIHGTFIVSEEDAYQRSRTADDASDEAEMNGSSERHKGKGSSSFEHTSSTRGQPNRSDAIDGGSNGSGMAAAAKPASADEDSLSASTSARHEKSQGVYDLSGADALPAGIAVQFRPLYDIQAKAVTGYICTPVYGSREGYDILIGVKNKKLYSDLDVMVLQAARQKAAPAIKAKQKIFFIAPVHYNTMADTTNNTFIVQNCAKLPAEEKQVIFFELSDISKSTGELTIKGIVDKIKPYTKLVILKTDIYGSSRKNISNLGVSLLSIDIRSSNLPEHALSSPMEKFIAEVKKSSLPTIMYGINTPSLAKSAKDAGFSALGGDAIHPLVKETDKPIRMSLSF